MKLILVFIASLWSSVTLSASDGEFNLIKLPDTNYLQASPPNLYTQIDRSKNYSKFNFEKNVLTIENLPRIRNLDGKGLCSACGPATLIQKMDCDVKKIQKCSDKKLVPDKELVNLMGIYAYNDHSSTSILSASGLNNAKNGLTKQKYLPDSALDFSGGDSYNILKNIQYSGFELYTESCYPFDQFSNSVNFKDPNRKGIFDTEKTDPIFKALEQQYNDARNNLMLNQKQRPDLKDPNQANLECNDCITQLQSQIYDLGKIQEETKILRALKKETFAAFLYTALFSNCNDQLKKFPQPKNIKTFPETSSELTYHDITDKITEVIKQQKPLILRNICAIESQLNTEICLTTHEVTVTGIKDVCEKNNPINCKKYFRIQECNGEDWKDVNGEWFEAEQIIKQMLPENSDIVQISDDKNFPKFKRRTSPNQKIKYESGSLIWLDY